MSDIVFDTVALPMCMVVLAYIYWRYTQDRDRSRKAAQAGPAVSVSRMSGALRNG